ncbi:hypothetical protein Slin15195_G073200 [Septoria linicola]|uniref:Uncharacterized protein n=1 Tax=Septoria linicola TaxID=215465 RepID=A0A9Q9EJQ0_9PEZI|nr:hypothetical protein Slin15195_G073200 [Septoria linicola]
MPMQTHDLSHGTTVHSSRTSLATPTPGSTSAQTAPSPASTPPQQPIASQQQLARYPATGQSRFPLACHVPTLQQSSAQQPPFTPAHGFRAPLSDGPANRIPDPDPAPKAHTFIATQRTSLTGAADEEFLSVLRSNIAILEAHPDILGSGTWQEGNVTRFAELLPRTVLASATNTKSSV